MNTKIIIPRLLVIFGVFSSALVAQGKVSGEELRPQLSLPAILPEELRATKTGARKDMALLLTALTEYQTRKVDDDFSSLERFIRAHPNSCWAATLRLNDALLYRSHGYQLRSLGLFKALWYEYKCSTDPVTKAIADRAVGEYIELLARLGRTRELIQALSETESRDLSGPATVQISGSREGLWMMENRPGISFLCGPRGMCAVWSKLHPGRPVPAALLEYESTSHGTSLAMLVTLGKKVDMSLKAVKVALDAELPVPSLIHLRSNHFAAVLDRTGDTYLIEDPTFGAPMQISARALREEGSGYFLVPAERAAQGWKEVEEKETATIWGMGNPGQSNPRGTSNKDTQTCSGPKSPMMIYTFHAMLASLHLEDTPINYATHAGPPVALTVSYNQREYTPAVSPTWTNFGPKTAFSYLSYLDVTNDPITAGASVTVYTPGGGSEVATGFVPATGLFALEHFSQTQLAKIGSGAAAYYERRAADGSKLVYAQASATTFPKKYFISRILDSAGAAVTISYDSSLRISRITDALSRVTKLNYDPVATGSLYLVQSATDHSAALLHFPIVSDISRRLPIPPGSRLNLPTEPTTLSLRSLHLTTTLEKPRSLRRIMEIPGRIVGSKPPMKTVTQSIWNTMFMRQV